MSTLSQDYPRLASFALSTDVSVKVIMNVENLDDIFLLLISQQAYEEFQHLQTRLQNLPYDVDAHPIYKIVWKSSCTPRKFFAWLVLVDRLNTKSMLRQRHLNIQGTVTCVMCNSGAEETIDHVTFSVGHFDSALGQVDTSGISY
jgi:hypothetical protein